MGVVSHSDGGLRGAAMEMVVDEYAGQRQVGLVAFRDMPSTS